MLFLFKEIETFRIHRWHNTRNYSIKKYKAALIGCTPFYIKQGT